MTALAAATALLAVVYVRISKDKTGAGLGVDRQEQDCRALAARLGLAVAHVYVDNDLSAYSGKPRPEYLRMLADLQRPDAPRVVLTWHTDRLHRRNAELEEWITKTQSREIVVHTVKAGPVDLATPSGRMVARQLGAVAQYESEHKSERIKGKFEQKAAAGEYMGGPVPFGWRRGLDGALEIEPAEAELIASGTRTLLDGGSLRTVVRAWNASDVRPRKRAEWLPITVRQVLIRWRNAGVHMHRGEVGGKAQWRAIPGFIADDGTEVPGVTADDVRAVRELFDRRADGHRFDNRAASLLAGIARCPCGAVVRTARDPRGKVIYRCETTGVRAGHITRQAAAVDDVVRQVIAARLALPDLADLLPVAESGAVDVPALRAEVHKLRERLDELAVMLADGDLDRAGYRTARDRVSGRLEAAEGSLSAATRRSPVATLATSTDPAAAFLAAELDTQRAVIRELAEVTITKQVTRTFDPASVVVAPRTP